MKINKILACGVAVAMMAGAVYADDFDFGSDDFGFGGFGGDTEAASAVEITGEAKVDARSYINGDDKAKDLPVDADAAAKLDVKYSSSKADAEVVLNLNSATLKDYPEDILNELVLTGYLGNFKLEAGKMKVVWGKGDKLHVIDNFNADDYTDFIIPDYLDRRIATPMVKGSYAFDYSNDVLSNMKIEAVYTPFLPTDRFATSGRWTPAQVSALTDGVTATVTAAMEPIISNLEHARIAADKLIEAGEDASKLGALAVANGYTADLAGIGAYVAKVKGDFAAANTAYIMALNNASALSADPSVLYPNTNTLKYGQAGVRFTASVGTVDLGASYYYGHYKQPSANALKMQSFVTKYLSGAEVTDSDKFLEYDQKQTFGLEAATILWHFNVRGEAAYNLTKDTDGTDPFVHNNSIQWLGGFDIDLPIWNMNLNVQETGTYILKNDEIESSMYKAYDVDYAVNGYCNNRIVANITTSFKNDQICPEVTVMYGINNGDLVVMPKIVYKPVSELSLIASGMYMWNKDDNSEFVAWKDNNFFQIGASISF